MKNSTLKLISALAILSFNIQANAAGQKRLIESVVIDTQSSKGFVSINLVDIPSGTGCDNEMLLLKNDNDYFDEYFSLILTAQASGQNVEVSSKVVSFECFLTSIQMVGR